MQTYRPDYYVVPAQVWDDEQIKPLSAKLYGVIYWLSQLSKGKCTASNEFLAAFLRHGTSVKSVSNMLCELEDGGYIRRVFSGDSKIERKEIIPLVKFGVNKVHQIVEGGTPNSGLASPPNSGQISNSNKEKKIIAERDKSLLPVKESTPLKRLVRFYEWVYHKETGTKPVVKLVGKDGGVLKSLLKTYTEVQIAALLVVHMTWMGPNNNNELEYDRLRQNGFPLSWLSNSANKYIRCLEDVDGVRFDDGDEVYKFVTNFIKEKK